MSFVDFPYKENFFLKKKFCHVASHIWQVSCQDNDRKYFLELKHPKLCQVLQSFDAYFGFNSTCKGWPHNYFNKQINGNNTLRNSTLENEMYQYGQKNLAHVKLMIQSPFITKIKRDVTMTFTDYIANTGGLLGLCLGFSFISGVEVIFWILFC